LKWGYTRQNLDADGRWRFGKPVALTLGGGWERWDRVNHREVPTTNEVFAKAALDVTPVDWLVARLTYRPSFRRIDEYNTFAHHEHQVLEEDTAASLVQGQSVLLRKFDEAERDRQAVNLTLTFTPLDTLSVSVVGEYGNDQYVRSPLGLQDATRWSLGFDGSWQPNWSWGDSYPDAWQLKAIRDGQVLIDQPVTEFKAAVTALEACAKRPA